MKSEEAMVGLGQRTATFVPTNKLGPHSQSAFDLQLYFVHPEVNPVNNLVKVWYELDNQKRLLLPGISGKVRIQSDLEDQFVESSDE